MANLLNILIPDGESTFALLLLPCLSQIENGTIYVLSTKNKNPIKHSRYVENYQLVKSKENWLKWKKSQKQRHRWFLNTQHAVALAEW